MSKIQKTVFFLNQPVFIQSRIMLYCKSFKIRGCPQLRYQREYDIMTKTNFDAVFTNPDDAFCILNPTGVTESNRI